ncbi:MAG: B12-binding domain-containing radical SAM protein [Verrucomicrobiae bacterium]|nr:B12-binding domain-containing radical SAM protein [Verrucomicrobiae bacterium]
MADIVLATLNAKYIHAAFGLRYLLANLGELRPRAELFEADINQRPLDIAEALLARSPRIIGLGVYIWNATETTELVAILKRLRPDVKIILGGPEVSYETGAQAVAQMADHVITGEADLMFAEVCAQLLQGTTPPKLIPAPLPDLKQLALPYNEYTAQDLAHRIVYVEASRGCPFSCEFCLSSLDVPVRAFPLPAFLEAMQRLLDRGLQHFKFVDRTFNLDLRVSRTILEFFLARMRPGLFLHFEMIPDRLPQELREILVRFPPGSLQFEVGVQTFDEATAARIQRRQNLQRLEDNFRFLRQHTGVHIHADLIAGLPGEDLASFAAGFDRLLALEPHEIQVGILKRLRGTPIVRHDQEWGMIYNPLPPYDLLENRLIPFAEMQRLRRFARYWDLVGNSGNFVESRALLWRGQPSAFRAFMEFSDWLFARVGRTDAIALPRLLELLFEFLRGVRGWSAQEIAPVLLRDYQRGGRHDCPPCLQPFLPPEVLPAPARRQARLLRRQARHRHG